MLMWAMSDRAIPRSFRMMEGFGVHTYRLVNEEGKSTFVTFHWRPKLGMQSVLWDEALKISIAAIFGMQSTKATSQSGN
jgi:catalase